MLLRSCAQNVLNGQSSDMQKAPIHAQIGALRLAVAVGFEPTVGLHPHTLSRRAP